MHRRGVTLLLFAVVVAGAAPVALPGAAGAAPIDDKRQQAHQLEVEITTNAEQLAVLNEEIKGVELKLQESSQTIADATARIDAARAEAERLEAIVRARAASVYRASSTGGPTGALLEIDLRMLATRNKYAAAAGARDDEVLDDLADARDELAARRSDAERIRGKAEADKATLDEKKATFDAANQEREQLLAQVTGEIQALVAQETAAREVTEAPRGQAGQTFDPGELPAPSGGAGAAVAFAQAQLGKPYIYGGVGPDGFDCSGLTMMAWRQAGVSMPHNDAAQMAGFPSVPMDQLQPGDLVWFPGHIALYVGGGAVIVAPRTGDAVKYQSIGLYQAAVRPG